MYNVTEFPVDRLSEPELRIREWEVVMAGGFGSREHQRLKDEIGRRAADGYSHPRPTAH